MYTNEERLYKLINCAKEYPNVITMSVNQLYINKDYTIYDLHINEHNNDEESFKKIAQYLPIIRSGLTLLHLKTDGSYKVVRKSLINLQIYKNGLLENKELSYKKEMFFKEIIHPCETTFHEGSSIEIQRYVKLNGMKTEVSYITKLDAWIISINNHSFVIKSQTDLELIKNEKDINLKLLRVGGTWLEILEKLNSLNLLNEFKLDMNKGITLIGEYVSSNSIIKYAEPGLILHNIVENTNDEPICISWTDSVQLFKKYRFMFSPVERRVKNIKNKAELIESLKEIYNSVSTSYLCDGEQGSVINNFHINFKKV